MNNTAEAATAATSPTGPATAQEQVRQSTGVVELDRLAEAMRVLGFAPEDVAAAVDDYRVWEMPEPGPVTTGIPAAQVAAITPEALIALGTADRLQKFSGYLNRCVYARIFAGEGHSGDAAAGQAPQDTEGAVEGGTVVLRPLAEALPVALAAIREAIAAGHLPADGRVESFSGMGGYVNHVAFLYEAIRPGSTDSDLSRDGLESRCEDLAAAIDATILEGDLNLGLSAEQLEAISDCYATHHFECDKRHLDYWDVDNQFGNGAGYRIRVGSFYLTHDQDNARTPSSGGEVPLGSSSCVVAELLARLGGAEDGTGEVCIRTEDRETLLAQRQGTRDELIAYLAGLLPNL